MQKITKVCMIGLFSLIMSVFSCQKVDKIQPVEANTTAFKVEDVKVEDGILTFSSQLHFDSVMEELKKQSNPDYFEKISNFDSMHEKRKSITNQDYEKIIKNELFDDYSDILYAYEDEEGKRLEPIINDLYFESVVNAKGLIKIGEYYHKIGEKNVYKFKKGEVNSVSILNKGNLESNTNIEKLKVVRTFSTLKNKNARRDIKAENYYSYDGRDYRFRSNFGHNNWGFYANVFVNIIHEKLVYGIFGTSWWANCDAPSMSFSYGGYIVPVCVNTNGLGVNGSASCSNGSEEKHVPWGGPCLVTWNYNTGAAQANCTKVGGGNLSYSFYY